MRVMYRESSEDVSLQAERRERMATEDRARTAVLARTLSCSRSGGSDGGLLSFNSSNKLLLPLPGSLKVTHIVSAPSLELVFLPQVNMSDPLSDDGSDFNQDDTQEDIMTPAELIAKLEEVCACWRLSAGGVYKLRQVPQTC